MEQDMNADRKRFAGIMGILMLFFILFSSVYMIAEADHECTGDHCPVCVCIEQCENMLYQIGTGVITVIEVIIPVLYTAFYAVLISHVFTGETLISEKVRMNN